MDDKQNGEIRVERELDFESLADTAFVYNITVWVSHQEALFVIFPHVKLYRPVKCASLD